MVSLKDALASITNVEDIVGSGFFTSKKVGVFAALTAPDTVVITAAATHYPIPGTFSNDPVEGFSAATVVTPGIKYDESLTQCFEIDWHATISSDTATTEVTCGVSKGGVPNANSEMSSLLKNIGQNYSLSGTDVEELAQNNEIQLTVQADKACTLTFQKYTTSINEFFD